MGSKIYLKKDIVPHKFNIYHKKSSQLASSAMKRKLEFQESLYSDENKPSTSKDFSGSSGAKRKLIFEELYQSPKKESPVPTVCTKTPESLKETEVEVSIESPSGKIRVESIQEKEKINREVQVSTSWFTEEVNLPKR